MENEEQGFIAVSVETTYVEPFHEMVKTYSYSWCGGKLCWISMDFLQNHNPDRVIASSDFQLGDMIRIGPYRLVVIDIGLFNREITGRRVDSRFESLIWSGWIRLRNWFYMIYKIALFTGVVWKWVDYDPAVQTSWRDFKLFKKLREK